MLKSKQKILEEVAGELSTDFTENVSKRILMRNFQTNMYRVTDETFISSIKDDAGTSVRWGKKMYNKRSRKRKVCSIAMIRKRKYQLNVGNLLV